MKKLTFIKTNAPLLIGDQVGVDWEESESEEELNMGSETSDDDSYIYMVLMTRKVVERNKIFMVYMS